jgi:hypothetical protein
MSSLIPKVIADLELQIASAIGIGDTSFTLNASTDDDGVAIPAGIYCFTVDNGTSNKEYLIGQVNGTAVTSVKSVSRQGAETTGALKKHRIGAPCILTDFAAVQRVVDILKGVNTLDGANPVSYGTEPTLSDRKELATVGYVLDAAFGGAITFDSQVITNVTAGESVVLGDLVYFKTSDQEWYKVDADTAATVVGVQLGIAKGTGSDGVAITGGVQLSGVFTTSGLTAGSLYYASNTAGGYTTTAGTIKQVVGVALSTTRLLLTLPNPQTVSSREKDALSGGGVFGTPSGTNKFQTEQGTIQAIENTLNIQIQRFSSLSNVIVFQNNTQRSTTSTSFVKLKEIQLNEAVTQCRLRFRSWVSTGSGGDTYREAAVYLNGSIVGSAISVSSNSSVIWTHDFTTPLSSGDLIQIYGRRSGTAVPEIFVEDMHICYTTLITEIKGLIISSASPLIIVDVLNATSVT